MNASVTLDLPIAAPGNRVRADVTITNISDEDLVLERDDNCGRAFGSVDAQGLVFGSAGDQCYSGSDPVLVPGSSRTQSASADILDGSVTGKINVIATAVFMQSIQTTTGGVTTFDKRITASTTLTLANAATGTRTFTVFNDTSGPVLLQCPCTPVPANYALPNLLPGRSITVTSSVYGEFRLSPDNHPPQGCLNVSSVPAGKTDAVLRTSRAGACPG